MSIFKSFFIIGIIFGITIFSSPAMATETSVSVDPADDGSAFVAVAVFDGTVELTAATFVLAGELNGGSSGFFTPGGDFLIFRSVDVGDGAKSERIVLSS